MKTALLLILALLQLTTLEIDADEGRTKEGRMVFEVAQVMRTYQLLHSGHLPITWIQISECYELDSQDQEMLRRYGYKLKDRYEFITQPMPVYGEPGTQVLMIRTLPLKDRKPMLDGSYQLYRYIVYQYPSGNISGSWIPEEIVQKTLKTAGVIVTPKSGLPEFEYDKHPLDYVPPADGIDRLDPVVPPKASSASPSESPPSPVSPLKPTLPAQIVFTVTAPASRSWIIWLLAVITALVVCWRLLRKPAR